MAELGRAKVYRNVELRQEFAGIEPIDGLLLGGLFGLLALFNRHAAAWNLLLTLIAYAALRVGKRGKPDGYTTTLLRFFARRSFYSAASLDQEQPARLSATGARVCRNPQGKEN
jgi:hypothetical protein